jgi:hypothetical protein
VTVRQADISSVTIQMRPRVRVRGRVPLRRREPGRTHQSIFRCRPRGLGILLVRSARWPGSDGTLSWWSVLFRSSSETDIDRADVVARSCSMDATSPTSPRIFEDTWGARVVFTQRPSAFGIVTEESTQLAAGERVRDLSGGSDTRQPGPMRDWSPTIRAFEVLSPDDISRWFPGGTLASPHLGPKNARPRPSPSIQRAGPVHWSRDCRASEASPPIELPSG